MKKLLLSTIATGLMLQGAPALANETPAATAPVTAAAPAGPAMWKVADEDTTIYLFGTVHALPRDVKWMEGTIETALDSSEALVTEIPGSAMKDPAMQQMFATKAMLPADQSLRQLLDADQRVAYETAMAKLGIPIEAFDRFEPWFAGMTLAMLPLMKAGYDIESGVEQVFEKEAAPEMKRDALETIEYQIDLFDKLTTQSQVAFLMSSAQNIDEVTVMMDKMLVEWMEGDADGLAELLNQGLTDPQLAEALLYRRNANWAQWIEDRMDNPGTVFIAVGAGHLAGQKSVQDYLAERGFTVQRVK